VSAEEILDVVDADDRVVGQATRADVYARGLTHRVAFVLVRDSGGRIFVHRRTETKMSFPGAYDMFVGGVVGAGETYDEAALREAEEELGVSGLDRPTPLFRFLYRHPADGSSWWSGVYEVRCDLPVRPQVAEIAWHAWISPAGLDRMLAEHDWTPDGVVAYERLTARSR
jgi:8-oxo-dGTP pyrophosphatase MutT (NUDIX family)